MIPVTCQPQASVFAFLFLKPTLPRRCTPFSSLSVSSSRSQQYTPRPKVSHPTCPPALLAVPAGRVLATPWFIAATTERTFSATASTPPIFAATPMSVVFNLSVIHVLNGLINSLLDRPMAHSHRIATQVAVPLQLSPPAVPVVAAQSLGLHPLQWKLPLHAHLPLRISRSEQA